MSRTDSGRAGDAAAARVFSVAPGEPFLDRLASTILNGNLPVAGGRKPSPLELPDYTILLPTRRAARALQEAFLRVSGQTALLLPSIRPIAESDEELSLLSGIVSRETLAGPDDSVPLAISELERRLVLTELVLLWSRAMRKPDSEGEIETLAAGARSPAQAQHLASELCRLMDMLETENVPIARLETIVPDNYSEHWQKTLDFLKIATGMWPAHLAESGRISAADRRNRLILAEARRLERHPPRAPVIVAGVTGSIPATGELMKVVARLPLGAIVLPGYDPDLDEETAAALETSPEHPQHGLSRLLASIGVERTQITPLPGGEDDRTRQSRLAFLREAMRPASSTARWHDYARSADKADVARALDGIALIEAPAAADEAEAVALILRHAAETPGQTAALVSPDRLLARRVAVRLESWGIRVDDSAGRPFAKTIPGTFLDLIIEAVATHFGPAPLVSLLKHPLTRLGMSVGEARRSARAVELGAFRTAYLGRGLDGVDDALDRAAVEKRLSDTRDRMARELLVRLRAAFGPLSELFAKSGEHALRDLADAHVRTAEALAQLPDPDAANPLWDQEAGKAATLFFTSLLDPGLRAPRVEAADYPDLYRSLVANESVRPLIPVHPRIFIWGPYEARLQQPDIVVLGSLNDGTWPEAADPGPWLNRPMRSVLKLPSPEEEIGRAAHDFISLMGGKRIYLTRAKKVDGVPTVPSRWLMRMRALLGGIGNTDALKADQPWLGWARMRDSVARVAQIRAPAPSPPVAMRPRKISVSGVETWIANPYAIFAKEILTLYPLPPLGNQPDAALRGSIVHEALGRFATRHDESLPTDIETEILRIVGEVIGDYAGHPRVAAFWKPRLERFAHWFAATERERRTGVLRLIAESKGILMIDAPAGPFTLTARADRIDVSQAGVTITDYKTGSNLAGLASRAANGLAPQLLLEAAIAAAGGYAEAGKASVLALKYISASGGEPPGEEKLVKGDVPALAQQALDGLGRLIAAFDDPATPYRAVRRGGFTYDYDDYAHLARVKEWSAEGDEGEGAP